MIYGYIDAGDAEQTERQKKTLGRLAAEHNGTVEVWLDGDAQTVLSGLFGRLVPGDILIVRSISVLGRNVNQIMTMLQHIMEKEAHIWTAEEGYRLGSPFLAKALAYAFALSAEIAQSLTSHQTKEALKRLKTEGKVLGRPKGCKNKSLKLSGQEETIISLLNQNVPKVKIAKILGVNRLTIQNFIKNNLELYQKNERFYERPAKKEEKGRNMLKTNKKITKEDPAGIQE